MAPEDERAFLIESEERKRCLMDYERLLWPELGLCSWKTGVGNSNMREPVL